MSSRAIPDSHYLCHEPCRTVGIRCTPLSAMTWVSQAVHILDAWASAALNELNEELIAQRRAAAKDRLFVSLVAQLFGTDGMRCLTRRGVVL